ncbi:MAG: undecaprenyl-diphosphate phosphatase, partial [Deltaproteobacteria bacterium]|nr:undecaprenyl-diphosphate phosphatase [Deltaproteobacteria bacterium]
MRWADLVCLWLVVMCSILMAAVAQPEMSLLQAAVLGVVEGLTEYLPVSSTGHLLVVSHFMGLDGSEVAKAAVDAYSIAIQIGAILAVIVLYPGRIGQMVKGLIGRDKQGL